MFRHGGVTSIPGKKGMAWQFNGVDAYGADGQSTPDFTDGSYSIAYFMKDSTTSQNEYMLGKGIRTASQGKYYHMTEGGGLFQARMEGPSGEPDRVINGGDFGLFDGEWHHVAQVRDVNATELRLYVDAALVDTQSDPKVLGNVSNFQTLYLGAGELRATNDISYFSDCALDEVRLYDGVLTEEEIAALATPCLLGDVNLDTEINGLDVDPFVGLVTSGGYQCEADMNADGAVNGLDVDPFVAAIIGVGGQAVPEPSTLLLACIGLVACAHLGTRRR
jgi:hypothetical protein